MRVVRDGAKRLYQQIYAQLRARIFSGEIAAGQPLPSYRFMSRKYQVNVATVEKAYDLLEANGYIRRCQGSGCCVLPLDNFKFFAERRGARQFSGRAVGDRAGL
ncbi:MAG: GntR family transcriptional regulator [Oscillospiraceae bacterium]